MSGIVRIVKKLGCNQRKTRLMSYLDTIKTAPTQGRRYFCHEVLSTLDRNAATLYGTLGNKFLCGNERNEILFHTRHSI